MQIFSPLEIRELVAQIVVFVILVVVLRVLFWQRILNFIEMRRKHIRTELETIQQGKEEISQLKEEYQDRIRDIDIQAQIALQKAVEEGKKQVGQMRKQAEKEAAEIIERAKQDIKYELLRAKGKLKNEIVELTIKAMQELIQERITEEDDRRIVMGFLEKIEQGRN